MDKHITTTSDAVKSTASWFENENVALDESIRQGDFDVATRGFIGRKTANGVSFEARYHHWDSYPQALGQELYELYHNHFNLDIETMMAFLIDEHPAGWSNIVDCDFSYAPGFSTPDCDLPSEDERNNRPQCYCHGERRDNAVLITSFEQARQMGCEYGYIIDITRMMDVYSRTGETWQRIAVIDLNSSEPDWDTLEQDEDEE